jgi:Domain of unknown function (DUF4390)
MWMKLRSRITCLAAAIAVTATAAVAAENLRIVPVQDDDQVYVTVEMNNLNVNEMREVISSGLRTTFTYDIELRMVVPGWVDRTVATAVVTISDQFDNLTRQHKLSKAIDGRVAEAIVSADEAAAHKWLTTLTRVPLCDTSKLDPNRDYYIRISARERPRGTSLFGWGQTVTGQAKFTFIP